MRIISATAAACLLAVSVTMAQAITDAQILDAIKAGEAKKYDHLVSGCYALGGFGERMASSITQGVNRTGGFHVVLSTNTGRIASLAAQAKRLYKKFSIDDVTEELRAPAVVVSIEPADPSNNKGSISVAAPIEHVVLKSKTKDQAEVDRVRHDPRPDLRQVDGAAAQVRRPDPGRDRRRH